MQLCLVRGMPTTRHIFTLRTSLFALVAGSMMLASCVAMDEADDDQDQQADELDGTPQLPHIKVCDSGARFACKAHIRVETSGQISLAATPSGLGPADF